MLTVFKLSIAATNVILLNIVILSVSQLFGNSNCAISPLMNEMYCTLSFLFSWASYAECH